MYIKYYFSHCTDPAVSADGTRGDAAGNLDRGEIFAMCLQQVGPKGVWLRFHDVERILDMYTGEIQAMGSDIRLKEHGRTMQKTSLTEVQEKLQCVCVCVCVCVYLLNCT